MLSAVSSADDPRNLPEPGHVKAYNTDVKIINLSSEQVVHRTWQTCCMSEYLAVYNGEYVYTNFRVNCYMVLLRRRDGDRL